MNREIFDALEALCMMWEQYCDSDWGHEFMSAGEQTEEVLDKYKLLIPIGVLRSKVNWDLLEEYRAKIKY